MPTIGALPPIESPVGSDTTFGQILQGIAQGIAGAPDEAQREEANNLALWQQRMGAFASVAPYLTPNQIDAALPDLMKGAPKGMGFNLGGGTTKPSDVTEGTTPPAGAPGAAGAAPPPSTPTGGVTFQPGKGFVTGQEQPGAQPPVGQAGPAAQQPGPPQPLDEAAWMKQNYPGLNMNPDWNNIPVGQQKAMQDKLTQARQAYQAYSTNARQARAEWYQQENILAGESAKIYAAADNANVPGDISDVVSRAEQFNKALGPDYQNMAINVKDLQKRATARFTMTMDKQWSATYQRMQPTFEAALSNFTTPTQALAIRQQMQDLHDQAVKMGITDVPEPPSAASVMATVKGNKANEAVAYHTQMLIVAGRRLDIEGARLSQAVYNATTGKQLAEAQQNLRTTVTGMQSNVNSERTQADSIQRDIVSLQQSMDAAASKKVTGTDAQTAQKAEMAAAKGQMDTLKGQLKTVNDQLVSDTHALNDARRALTTGGTPAPQSTKVPVMKGSKPAWMGNRQIYLGADNKWYHSDDGSPVQ